VLQNAHLDRCAVAVGVADGHVVLPGAHNGVTTIERWGQGNTYQGTSQELRFVQGPLPGRKVHASLLDERGQVVGRGRPQYEDYAVDQLVSVKAEGAVGDGKTASAARYTQRRELMGAG
jgi:glucan 1,3-beta-glucosidase